ncbi:hypothetical protein EVG20_g411 [Dentipellis fragilis]|uniref:Uncharacterized protein n=1 Tax=Dentipellis fragilis TaxID=205917 RepID=A0A4Y9ZFL8_9AGAM|nr:hypothetical protein EVG20_g411 [Dentipellis fragilis]
MDSTVRLDSAGTDGHTTQWAAVPRQFGPQPYLLVSSFTYQNLLIAPAQLAFSLTDGVKPSQATPRSASPAYMSHAGGAGVGGTSAIGNKCNSVCIRIQLSHTLFPLTNVVSTNPDKDALDGVSDTWVPFNRVGPHGDVEVHRAERAMDPHTHLVLRISS